MNQVAKTDRRRKQRTSPVCAQAVREPAGFAKGQTWPRASSSLGGSRQAFTLIEVILAVALSLVLVLAIGSAVDLYRRMTTAAQDDLSEMRLVRAVFSKFENDIRSVVPPQPIGSSGTTASSTASSSASSSSGSSGSSSSGSSGSSSGSSSSSSSSTSSNQTDPFQYVYSRSVFGLFGDGSSLVLDTLTPHRMPLITQAPIGTQTGSQSSGQPNTDPSNLAGIHGDMKVISYFVLGEGTSSILPTGAGSGQLTPEGKAMTSGLARLEGDRTAIGYAMETSSTSSMSARIIAPEVQSIAFRYFDGTNWVQSWSGATAQALPTAVEIVITVSGATDPYGARTQADRDRAPRSYRHVVAITSTAPPQLISEQTINSTAANMSQ